MAIEERNNQLDKMKEKYPGKFVPEDRIFSHIHPGDRIFVGTGCGEPQYLVRALVNYVQSHPKAFFDAEVLQVWTLGVSPYTEEEFKHNFRHNSFFIGNNTRDAINRGMADYSPIFFSAVPHLFRSRRIPVDVALIQCSPPDDHGFMSLGISVDIVRAAVEAATQVIVQVNPRMPRVHGDTFIQIEDMDFIIPYDEPLLEYEVSVSDEIAQRIGKYVARIVQDGDTIQVGYGSLPNAILANLIDKKHLGFHSELLSDGVADLMKKGVIDNSRKIIDRGKAVASFCLGKRGTYEFLHDHPACGRAVVNLLVGVVLHRRKSPGLEAPGTNRDLGAGLHQRPQLFLRRGRRSYERRAKAERVKIGDV